MKLLPSQISRMPKQLLAGRNGAQRWLYQRLHLAARRSPYEQIYHCCTQRTGSQWFRAVFREPLLYRYTGLAAVPLELPGDPWRYADCAFDMPVPRRGIMLQLYIGYPTYRTIPKTARYRTFFILRDPRDIAVSWYFSTRYSHSPRSYVPEYRQQLETLSFHEGLEYTIDVLRQGVFPMQRSWHLAAASDRNVRIFRYEDFARDNRTFLRQLFDYLDIPIPEPALAALCERHRFERKAGGRAQGSENQRSHYRKGIAGDWKNHFDESTLAYFRRSTHDLLEILGYDG